MKKEKKTDYCRICGKILPTEFLGKVEEHSEYNGEDSPILVCFECN